VILKDELGERGVADRSTTVYRDCYRQRHVDPIPAELLPRAVAARMRQTTFRLDDGRSPLYSCTSNDAFRPNYDHRNYINVAAMNYMHKAAEQFARCEISRR